MKIFEKVILIGVLALLVFSNGVLFVSAQEKQYWYDSIIIKIQVNKDSTFDVEERQNFHYIGNFNRGLRNIPLNKIDSVSDIQIIDGESGNLLEYSRKKLDKLNQSSWGKFTYSKEKGVVNIEWYYNLADTNHEWIIKYKVHGGIGFFNDHDELYWNLFTDYGVPIKKAEIHVDIPEPVKNANDLKQKFYSSVSDDVNQKPIFYINPDLKGLYYSTENIISRQDLTIFAGWPKGIVNQNAYWFDFIKIYFGYIFSVIIIFGSLIAGFLYWYFTEKFHKGRGIIIAQYEPPQNLKPAMAEVIIKEKITSKAWPATIVDLAVRGYIKIKEDKIYWPEAIFIIAPITLLALFFIPFIIINITQGYRFAAILFIVFFFVFLQKSMRQIRNNGIKGYFIPKNYIIEKAKPFSADDSSLEGYEKRFSQILFREKDYFSIKELKKAGKDDKLDFYMAIKVLESALCRETESDTNAFEKLISNEYRKNWFYSSVFTIILILFYLSGFISADLKQYYIALSAGIVSVAGLYVFIKYEARLSKEGAILKEEWLGFKLYLETAEKYRLQNLTPETFEKYLPYAMIFGVEKQWAKAFEPINIKPPTWYGGASVGGGNISGGGINGGGGFSNFSPSVFSASFSSSFSSAFSSASGGSGGGGGGAGGGGGGGGGGAD